MIIEMQDWRYEMRREIQEIVPGLFLGPYSCSKNLQDLQSKGITHMVMIRDTTEQHIMKPLFPNLFQYHIVEASDSPMQNLIPYFPKTNEYIRSVLAHGGRVFVYCNSGISRSPTFVVAYMMESFKMAFQVAINYVQSKRFCMNPNETFKLQLREYEPIFHAREAIEQMQYTPEQVLLQGQRRRPIDEDEDEME
ncbi:tyrosine phosphatase-like protein-like protein [Polychytrium aggregatum]|uniref:tyrosine phosphatase-like protein-like protein n=1 Tax=Polychytrium aggregatum TaxID=110093 RepID=UPI0022FE5015|nr:tyrosine phosphatase-like protein-like protein [Polychytrium aggregatum]KAI9206122.1 tyrosine phosphatase-like protein-like protein [Polychytrium aggregatum]